MALLLTYYLNLSISERYHVYGQVPEPEMLVLLGRPLFLEMAGNGKAAEPLAMRPFLAWRWAVASARVMCSM